MMFSTGLLAQLLAATCIETVHAAVHGPLARSPPPAAPQHPHTPRSSSQSGCDALAAAAKNITFFPGSAVYEYEKTQFWSNTELLDPGCVFRPQSSQDVAAAIQNLVQHATPFSVRGGGHMGVPGSNNINAPGVLIVMSNLTQLSLNSDKSLVTLGPGHRWGAVYSKLAQYDLTVAGGRLSPVGVPGLLLAGGINFHGNQVGFSADTVVSYEVVTAAGTIITATASQNADLFWALKGGSSNFGIVTSFTMRTIPSTKVWAGTLIYSADHIEDVYKAIANYSAAPTDPKAHIVPAVVPAPNPANPDVIVVIMFYDSATVSHPPCFSMFFAIPTIGDSTAFKTVSQFADENGALVTPGISDVFVAGTFAGSSYEELLCGIQITNDTFYAALKDLHANIPPEDISILELDWQPLSRTWIEAGLKSNPLGSPLLGGLSQYESRTYLAYAEVVEWTNTKGNHDAFVAQWIQTTTASINEALAEAGLWVPFNYMGDAAGFQDIYDGYGFWAKAALTEVSRKYDPARVFQTLMPGGFKIGY